MAKRIYENGSRLYMIGQQKYPSVTSVLSVLDKGGLVPWALREALGHVRNEWKMNANNPSILGSSEWINQTIESAQAIPDRIKQTSADFGTRVHNAIDAIVRGEEPIIDKDTCAAIEGFQQWYSTCGIQIDPRGDTLVTSNKYQYAGALDALGCDENGKVCILDFKTSNWVHPTYALQLAAYTYAYVEMLADGRTHLPEGVKTPEIPVALPNDADVGPIAPSVSDFAQDDSDYIDYMSEDEWTDEESIDESMYSSSTSSVSNSGRTLAPGNSRHGFHTSAHQNSNNQTERSTQKIPLHRRAALRRVNTAETQSTNNTMDISEAFPVSVGLAESNTGRYDSVIPPAVAALRQTILTGNTKNHISQPSNSISPTDIRSMVVKINKTNGNVEVRQIKDLESCFAGFKAALLLWRLQNPTTQAGMNERSSGAAHMALLDKLMPTIQNSSKYSSKDEER